MRDFLIWMYSTTQPLWSIPAECVESVREALGAGWRVLSVEEEQDATGDGPVGTPERVLEEMSGAEVFVGFGIGRDAFLAGKRLRWVHSAAAGVGGSLFPEMVESDVLFTNSAGLYAEPVSEHVLAMILYFARGLDVAAAGMRSRSWKREALAGPAGPLIDLEGRVLGLVGYGGIGRAIGRRAAALGLRVWALRHSPPAEGDLPPEVERMWGSEGLDALLEGSDYVVLTVPETPTTIRLIGAREVGLMGKGAVLINVARGRIVDEVALADALRAGRLRGAGLDVFEVEPLPAESPLWGLDNVLLTPHVGGISPGFWERQTDLLIRNIRRYLDGRPMENLVDKRLGY